MRVNPLLSKIDPLTFIEDYLQAHGVEQTNLYLNPEEGCLDNLSILCYYLSTINREVEQHE